MEPALIEQHDLDLFTGHPVKIEIFEGPIDLLVYLVKREELDISEIALAQITGQYLAYLETMDAISIEVAGEFIVTAAVLLQLKARRLLPATVEEFEDEEDELALVSQMQQRVAQYRVYKEAAQALDESRQLRQRIYIRALQAGSDLPSGFVRLEDVSVFDIVGAVRELLKRAEAVSPGTVARPTVTLPERIDEVLFQLAAAGDQPLTLAELVGISVTRQMIIMTFLALLELIRRRRINVRQDKPRMDIVIRLAPDSGGGTDISPGQP